MGKISPYVSTNIFLAYRSENIEKSIRSVLFSKIGGETLENHVDSVGGRPCF